MVKRIYALVVVLVLAAAIIGSIQAFYKVSPEEKELGQEQEREQEQGQEQVHHQGDTATDDTLTEEESLRIAQEFVLKSPTYKFDGGGLTHIETKSLNPSCWVFVFEFTSRHAGYGNRSKQMVLQVITQHTAVVSVENGKVTSAILDGQWDMINQEMIK